MEADVGLDGPAQLQHHVVGGPHRLVVGRLGPAWMERLMSSTEQLAAWNARAL